MIPWISLIFHMQTAYGHCNGKLQVEREKAEELKKEKNSRKSTPKVSVHQLKDLSDYFKIEQLLNDTWG